MSVAAISSGPEVAEPFRQTECRVYERHRSDLATQCQPLAARGDHDMTWPGTVRDISAGGVGLILQRRFEPRTGLAVELPDSDDSSYTVFVRVVHATLQPGGGWLLGCQFVSPLSEDRLNTLLQVSRRRSLLQTQERTPVKATAETQVTPLESVITGVHFRATLPDGSVLSRSVTRLHITGDWPMPPGRLVSVWVGKKKKGAAVQVRVKQCHQEGGQWLVDCSFVKLPPADILQAFHKPRR